MHIAHAQRCPRKHVHNFPASPMGTPKLIIFLNKVSTIDDFNMANSWLQTLRGCWVIRGKLLQLQSSGKKEGQEQKAAQQLKGLQEFGTKPRGKGQTFGNVMLAIHTHTHTHAVRIWYIPLRRQPNDGKIGQITSWKSHNNYKYFLFFFFVHWECEGYVRQAQNFSWNPTPGIYPIWKASKRGVTQVDVSLFIFRVRETLKRGKNNPFYKEINFNIIS